MYNHYRKHWLARYWQEHGINIIPTICWSTKESYDFCFNGEPVNSVIAVSTQGATNSKAKEKLFIDGYNEMIKRLNPSCVIFYGEIPNHINLPKNYVQIDTYSKEAYK